MDNRRQFTRILFSISAEIEIEEQTINHAKQRNGNEK